MFTTMIGLLRRGVPILSVIDNPVMNERWVGIENEPSMLNGANLSTSSKMDIRECSLHSTSPQMFSSAEYLKWMELAKSVSFHHYGSESYSYCLLAAGHVELVVEADLKICDFLPVVKLIEGSGGVITDWNGSSLTIESDGHVLASASQSIHNQAIQILRSN
jgi:fructose-1,6-bisphosphatase/inositol monophosphatase family enzyme